MQNNSVSDIANKIVDGLVKNFDNTMKDFTIQNIDEDVNHQTFEIKFIAYNYFVCLISFERGRFGCSIKNGEFYISLDNSQKWYDTANFDIFYNEMNDEIKLRIPDKYLEKKGWK